MLFHQPELHRLCSLWWHSRTFILWEYRMHKAGHTTALWVGGASCSASWPVCQLYNTWSGLLNVNAHLEALLCFGFVWKIYQIDSKIAWLLEKDVSKDIWWLKNSFSVQLILKNNASIERQHRPKKWRWFNSLKFISGQYRRIEFRLSITLQTLYNN